MPVLFNFIPGAGLIGPGVFFERNSAGTFSGQSYAILLGHKSSAGSATVSVPVPCATIDEAASLAGPGSQLYELYRTVRRAAPAATLYIAPVASSGSAAAWTVTIGTLNAAGGTATLEVAGRYVRTSVAPSESASTTATNLAAAINAWFDPLTRAYLPVTATASTNVVTLTARHPGTTMNEVEIFADGAIPGNLFTTSTVTIAQSVTAAGVADISAVLAALGDLPFHWIVSAFAETANLNAAETALSDLSGRWSYLQQIYGHYVTVSTGNTAALTSLGQGRNSDHVTILGRQASPTPSWEWVGSLFGRVLPWLTDFATGNVSRNQSDLVAEGVRAPRDRTVWPNYATRNALLGVGVSTYKVSPTGAVAIDKFITTARLNGAGQPDITFRDIQSMGQAMMVLIYLRAGLATRHANKAIADSNPANLPSLSTPAAIKADAIELCSDLVNRGILENLDRIASGLVVERNVDNPSRVDLGFQDMDRVNPLDILAANVTFRG